MAVMKNDNKFDEKTYEMHTRQTKIKVFLVTQRKYIFIYW